MSGRDEEPPRGRESTRGENGASGRGPDPEGAPAARGDFTEQADAYARARPGYPEEIVDRTAELAGAAAGDPVADIGAGTGLFTALLARRGFQVTAVEPNVQMRALALRQMRAQALGQMHARELGQVHGLELGQTRSRTLESMQDAELEATAAAPELAEIVWTDGTFEEPGLAPGSQRWITAAQAFHWADPPRALPALARALAPGGAFTVLWNDRDPERSEALRIARETIQRLAPGFDEGYRARDWAAVLVSTGHFAPPATTEIAHTIPMTRERFYTLWRSHHLLTRAIGRDGIERLIETLDRHLPPEDPLPITYRCRAWTSRKADG